MNEISEIILTFEKDRELTRVKATPPQPRTLPMHGETSPKKVDAAYAWGLTATNGQTRAQQYLAEHFLKA